jgi:hypothetical protein
MGYREGTGAPDSAIAVVLERYRAEEAVALARSGTGRHRPGRRPGSTAARAGLSLNEVLVRILERVRESGEFQRVLLCLTGPDRAVVQARLGAGDGADELVKRFRFAGPSWRVPARRSVDRRPGGDG